MKLPNILPWFIVLMSVLTTSCRKDASYVSLPEFKQKLVVNAFLSPDQALNEIYISSTKRRFGELYAMEPVGNLNVFLSDGTDEVKLDTTQNDVTVPYIIGYNFIVKNMPITAGKTYYLKVISNKGLTAETSCTIPVKRDFKIEVDTNSVKSVDEVGRNISTLYANLSITDFPGETNFYRLLYIYQDYRIHHGSFKSFSLKSYLMAEVPVTHVYQQWEGDIMYNDNGRDGKKFVIRSIEFPSVNYTDPNPYFITDSAFLRIYLLNTDKPYNDFHQSLLNYSLGDAPFTEPSFLYSNVKDGVGIFAAYTVDSVIFRLK